MNRRTYIAILFLGVALAYTLCFVFAGFGNHQDPLYWLYKYSTLEGGWMATGTLLTGGAIVRLFGAQLLPLRLAGWLCVVTAIALPYCCLQTKEQRRANLPWLALTYIFMGYGAFQEFSPGTLSVLLLSALWASVSKSNIKHHTSYIAAILLGIAVSVRFPNILALLVLIPLWKKSSLWKIPIAALSAGLIYLLGYFFITPSPMDAAMTSHDLVPMLTKLWSHSGTMILYALMTVGVLAIGKSFHHSIIPSFHHSIIPSFHHSIIPSFIVGSLLLLVAIYTIKPTQWYNADLTYLISAMIIVLAIKSPITNHQSPIAIGVLLLCVATLGTDTAWLKLFPAVLCLLPLAAVQYEAPIRRYLFTVLAIFSLVVIYRMSINSVGRTNLTQVQTISSVAPYQHIAIREAEQARLNQYIADYDSLYTIHHTPYTVLAVGQENHLMRAVTGCQAARFNEFWSNIYDSVYTAKYREIIRTERPVVFCSFSPQFKTKPAYRDKESAFERMLLDEGYQALDRSTYKYMIYIPTEY